MHPEASDGCAWFSVLRDMQQRLWRWEGVGGEFREVAGTTTGDSIEFWWSHGYEQAMLTDPLLTDVLRTLRNKNQLEWREGTQSTEVASEVLRTGWPWDVF